MNFIGLDIGGTKCAVSELRGTVVSETLRLHTAEFPETFSQLKSEMHRLVAGRPVTIGVSCGGPVDSSHGRIMNPPNLPESWHHLDIGDILKAEFGGKVILMNDANACAVAEWKFGAGRGTQHMIFITSGTGFGAGLILNGKLYEGASGDAGEIGHVRLRKEGPMGYGKLGSVEGFCSGGGIARLAVLRAAEKNCPLPSSNSEPEWSAKAIAGAARAGNPFAQAIMDEAAEKLGESLSILIDLFNPEKIILGGFYPKCRSLLEPRLKEVIRREALPNPGVLCQILPSELGEDIGNYGAIAAALYKV